MDTMLDRPRELRAITWTHEYAFPMRTLAWWTLAIAAVMGGLYFLVGFPPTFDGYFQKMYFHAVGLGLAALGAYLVIDTFELEAYEPPLDFPLRYRAFLSVVFGALGGLVFLNKDVFAALPDIGVGLFVAAFLLAFDVAGALLVELIVLPRKKAGIYDTRSRSLFDYIGRLIPSTGADRATYRSLGSGYWLTLISIASVLFAMAIGFVNLWIRALGPSIFAGWMGALGLDAAGAQDATLDPHSHMIAIALIALVVAIAAIRSGAFDSASPLRRGIARAGAWVTAIGVVLTSLVLGAVAIVNFAPPTVFASPDGVNGMAGDDAIMAIVLVGAVIVGIGLLADRSFLRDGLRLTVVATWFATVLITAVEGFWIEFHEDQFGGALSANDAAFSAAHPMTGIFLMLAIGLALLVADFYGVRGLARTFAAGLGVMAVVAAVVGTTLWTFVDPSNGGVAYGIYIAGIVIGFLTVLAAGVVVRAARTHPVARTELHETASPSMV